MAALPLATYRAVARHMARPDGGVRGRYRRFRAVDPRRTGLPAEDTRGI